MDSGGTRITGRARESAAASLALARKAAGWARRPGVFAVKLRRFLKARMSGRYRRAFEQGVFVEEPRASRANGLISVAMPVYRVAEGHLRAAIDSVRAQSHGNWELIIVDDASPDAHVGPLLEAAAHEDARIRLIRRPDNAGIALASNQALAACRGEYVAFLDHDDLLHPRALELAGRFLAGRPGVDWLFTDEDKVDERGRHREPALKPGWSRHLLLAFNDVCHLRVVRRAAIEAVGGHRAGFDGAQDYDLALRILAAGGRFAHLPGILYHWRAVRTSMALAAGTKPRAHERALRALAEHGATFGRGGAVSARVAIPSASFFELRRACDPRLPLAVAGDVARVAADSPGRALEPLAASDGMAALVAAARGSSAPLLLVPPADRVASHQLAELVALLQVPGTALAGGRIVRGRRVAASGWNVATDGRPFDPWRGLLRHDPGYLNLAAVAGPRALPPSRGFVAWREPLLAAWDAAAEVADPWRLGAGLARLGLEAVVTASVSWPGEPEPMPAGAAPEELTRLHNDWLTAAGVI